MSAHATSLLSPLNPHALRADFPILDTQVYGEKPLVYFDNAATSQRPRQVLDAMDDVYTRRYGNVHRGIHWLSDQSTDLYEEARDKVAAFLGAARREEVIFTSGTTAGINLVARSWGDANLRPGDEVLVTAMEHHSNLVPWHQLAQRTGCTIRAVPITDDGLLLLDRFDAMLGERTRLVAVAVVSNVLGTVNPVAEIARRAHEVGALVLADAAQSVPHLPTNVQHLGADFLAFSGHKMLGPGGVGVLWGRAELLDAMPPFLGGGSMIRRVMIDHFEPGDLPVKFEAGTPPIVPAIGLGAAIDYLQAIGMERIHQHDLVLIRRTHEMLQRIDGVRLLGPPPEEKSGLVSFVITGVHPDDLARTLDHYGVAIRAGHHCTMPLHERLGITASCRASFYLYNTPDEVDRLEDALGRALHLLRR